MGKDSTPFRAQKKFRLQGTVLRLFEHHLNKTGLKASEYIRQVVIKDLTSTYEVNSTGGIIRIRK